MKFHRLSLPAPCPRESILAWPKSSFGFPSYRKARTHFLANPIWSLRWFATWSFLTLTWPSDGIVLLVNSLLKFEYQDTYGKSQGGWRKKEEMSEQKMPANLVKGGLPSAPPPTHPRKLIPTAKVKLRAGNWTRGWVNHTDLQLQWSLTCPGVWIVWTGQGSMEERLPGERPLCWDLIDAPELVRKGESFAGRKKCRHHTIFREEWNGRDARRARFSKDKGW